ncbi:methyltransferase domain-containing protein [Flavilitoribacter nigricans]|uniref:SAM-dependent methyltransferase n=1 Tax=Flavilitoribacter nigricans (strain ATCC 23147 / DSM 23189 / NBRC 102662 / NCIMB 1420 / SS-2) TaxID=1122177 RepID=A0A2D0NIR7_FLAN2|nr:methyltransferase domain-containing protein [Flavilitoribacter nigricans]PHN08256.1 SAM-dependent methyltransferase [Flavilitoribacter nigricans DSM 23189 = NBRC 102662]
MEKSIYNSAQEEQFWTRRYEQGTTGWNIGYPAPPITEYFDQVADKSARILIPGAGNAYEAEYLYRQGFENVFVLDIARPPLDALKERFPDFPEEQLLHANSFEHRGQYDYVVEQTFFCSFPPLPENRRAYAQHVSELLRPGGKLVGVWFSFPLTGDLEQRPFGGSKAEYLSYFEPLFRVHTFEECYNSIKPRRGNELFGIFIKA